MRTLRLPIMDTVMYVALLVIFPYSFVYMREFTETDVPGNLTLLDIVDRYAHIGWEPVPRESMSDCYARYLVNIWSEDGNDTFLIVPEITSTEIPYFPGTVNNVTVSISNCNSVGPPSNMISFEAPEAEPPKPEFVNIHQLGNDSVLMTWYQPRVRTGKLLGYHIFYGDIAKMFSMENSNHYEVEDIDKEQAKIADLNEGATYKFGIYAINTAGSSKIHYKEFRLESRPSEKPGKPTFTWKLNFTLQDTNEFQGRRFKVHDESQPSLDHYLKISTTPKPKYQISSILSTTNDSIEEESCMTNLMVIWHPNLDENPGEYFIVKMRIKGEDEFTSVWTQYTEDYILANHYDACKDHEVVVTSVDGEFETDSDIQEISSIKN